MANKGAVLVQVTFDGDRMEFDVGDTGGDNTKECQETALLLETALVLAGVPLSGGTNPRYEPPKMPEAEAVAPARRKVRG